MARNHSLKDQLDWSSYFYRDILDSIKKSGSLDKSGTEGALRDLFEICYSMECYDVCVDSSIELGDKTLLRRLIGKERTRNFGVGSKMELLSYLLDEYPDEVAEELKALASSLIKAMGICSYATAAECVFRWKEIVPDAERRGYVKGVYDLHYRKINLWKEFKRRGVVLKRRKGVVEMVGWLGLGMIAGINVEMGAMRLCLLNIILVGRSLWNCSAKVVRVLVFG